MATACRSRPPRRRRRSKPDARAPGSARGPRPESIRLPVLWRGRPALGGPVPHVRRVEHPRRDRRPRRAAPRVPSRSVGGGRRPSRSSHAADAGRGELRRPVGIGELDRVLGGGLVAGSVVLLGGEPGHRQVDAPAPGRGRARRAARACCTRPARSPRPRSGCAPRRLGLTTGPSGDADPGRRRDRRRTGSRSSRAPTARASSSWTPCRPSPPTSSTGRRAASARSARRRCG